MAKLSLSDVWDDTRIFMQRELGLLLPIGFATFGIGALLVSSVAPQPTPETGLQAGSWMIWLIPAIIMMLIGYLAISRLSLRSHLSVGEALGDAMRLLPKAGGLALMVTGIITGMIVLASIVTGVVVMVMGLPPKVATGTAFAAVVPLIFWLSVRLLLLWPTLADREGGVRDAFTRAMALSRGNFLRLAGLALLNFVGYLLLAAVIEMAGGSVLLIVTRLIGMPALGQVLASVLMAAFNAVYATFWAVFLSRLYARMSA